MAVKKTLNMGSQLASQGYAVEVNPSLPINIDKDTMKRVFMDIDSAQFISRFKLRSNAKNPKILWWRVEQMLYNRPGLAMAKIGDTYEILPYVMTSGLNKYGMPIRIRLIAYNGEVQKTNESERGGLSDELTVNNYSGMYDPDAKAVILYDRMTNITGSAGTPPKALIQLEIINQIVHRLSYLNINLVNSQGKTIIICKDEKQAQVVKQELESIYNSTKNYSLIRSKFDVQVINNEIDYKEQEIWEDVMSWNNLRLESLGISNSGLFNKKERQITGEISQTSEQTNAVLYNAYMARKLFIQQCKIQFGDDPDFIDQFGTDFDIELTQMAMGNDSKKQEERSDDQNDGSEEV